MLENDEKDRLRFTLDYWTSIGLDASCHYMSFLLLRSEHEWKLYIYSQTTSTTRKYELCGGLQHLGYFKTHEEVTAAASKLVLAGAIFGFDHSNFGVSPHA